MFLCMCLHKHTHRHLDIKIRDGAIHLLEFYENKVHYVRKKVINISLDLVLLKKYPSSKIVQAISWNREHG